MKLIKATCLLILAALITSCATPKTDPAIDALFPKVDEGDYSDLIEKSTQKDKRYRNFYNTYQVYATILKTDVGLANLKKTAYYHQWDPEKTRGEREKLFQENSTKARFFLSFYSPEKDHNDLTKGSSIWKIYLDHNGNRYPGKIKKRKGKRVEIMSLYPHFTRFDSPYEVTFEVPMSVIENDESKLTLTSSLGTTTFVYKP